MPRSELIAVAIIDDNLLVRHALATLLGAHAELRVVHTGAAESAELTASAPDILLLDAGLFDRDSLGVAAGFRRAVPKARIIIMDLLPTGEDVREYVNAGVAGFAMKDATFEEFIETIRAVADGKNVLPPRLTESLFAQIAREANATDRAQVIENIRMTSRELQVIEIIGEGLSNKEIAKRLNIATHTVKSHVRNVMEKLSLHSRLQIANYSHRLKRDS
ncbi:MAG: response regulator transcription factor [Gemmatimonadaceae bacterium]